jgi:hypothetical protein
VFGLNVYETIEDVKRLSGFLRGEGYVLATGLAQMLWQTGILLGLAVGVYLLAPKSITQMRK